MDIADPVVPETGPALRPPPRYAGRGMTHPVLLGVLTTLGPISMDLYLPGLTNVSHNLRLGHLAASATLFACLAGLAAGQVVWGQVVDRLGLRGPLLLGISLWVATSLACALATSGAMLIAARAAQGLAGGCGMTVARTVLAQRLTGHPLAAALARIALVTNVCGVSAPLAGGALLGAVGWRGLFLVLAGGGVVVAGVTAVTFREPADERAPRPAGPTRVSDLLLPLRSPGFVRAAVVTVVSFAQIILYVSITPGLLRGHYGLSGVTYGLVFALTVVALVAGTRAAPLLLRHRGRLDPLVLACLLAGAGAAVEAVIGAADAWPPLPVLIAAFALGNATAGALMALSAAEALSGTTAPAGAASGLLGGLQFGGGAALASALTAAGVDLLGSYGLAAALLCLVSAGVAAAVQPQADL